MTKALAVCGPDLTVQNYFLKTAVQSENVGVEFLSHFLLEEEMEELFYYFFKIYF